MTATYDDTLGTDISWVRFLLGDVVVASALFSDEAIQAFLDLFSDNRYLAAAALADAAAAKYSRSVSFSVEGVSVQISQRVENYRRLADSLRAAANGGASGVGGPILTGISLGEMQAVDADSDRPPSAFRIGMHDTFGPFSPLTAEDVVE